MVHFQVDPHEMSARLIAVAVSLSVALLAKAQAQRIDDRAVFGVLQRADPTLFEMRVIHHVEVIWFGKTFYDGEGQCGVGGESDSIGKTSAIAV